MLEIGSFGETAVVSWGPHSTHIADHHVARQGVPGVPVCDVMQRSCDRMSARPVCCSPARPRTCFAPGTGVAQGSRGATARAATTEYGAAAHVHSSRCPVLAALQKPPATQLPWWSRLGQIFQPEQYQQQVLQGQAIATVPGSLGFPEQVLLADGDDIRRVLQGELEGLVRRGAASGFGPRVRLLGANALALLEEPAHQQLRGLIAPAFSGEALVAQVPRLVSVVDKHLARWAAAPGAVGGYQALRLLTFDIIIKLVLGRDLPDDHITYLNSLYQVWAAGFFCWPWVDLPFSPYSRALQARQQLVAECQAAVDAARAQAAAGEEVEGVIGSLVTASDATGCHLSDDQIIDNLLLVLFAGYDTSSTTLTRMLSLLQQHPAALQQLRQEQQQLVAAHGEELGHGVLRRMAYADAVIRETLRLHPVVSALFRGAKGDMELQGYRIPDAMPINLALYTAAQQDPRWAGAQGDLAPEVFNPGRMLTPEGQKQGWLMPFGAGPRFCLGASLATLEMKVFLALLARGYKYAADDDTEWRMALGRFPVNGLPLVVTRL